MFVFETKCKIYLICATSFLNEGKQQTTFEKDSLYYHNHGQQNPANQLLLCEI